MGYRIRYEVRRRDGRWAALAALAGLAAAAVTKRWWYMAFVRYVGEAIRGAG